MVQARAPGSRSTTATPQSFVPSIMTADPAAYRAQKHRIHHGMAQATHLELLVDTAAP